MNTDFERGFERGFTAGVASSKGATHYNHPLLSDEEVDRLLRDGLPLHEVMGRRTGKSTAQALRGLAWVIGHPGEVLRIVDHHPSRIANDNLMHTMREMADKLGLRNLVFNRANQTVSFGNALGANQ